MNYWEKLSDLLEQESELWKKIYQFNQEQMDRLNKDNLLQEGEDGLRQKEIWLNQIFRLHQEADRMQLVIETNAEKVTQPLQEEINQSLQKIMTLQQELKAQEQRAGQMLADYGNQIREEIRNYRSKKAVQTGYSAMPLLDESALLDKKN